MTTFGRIKGEESSTVTFKAATIVQTRNSSAMQQEIVSIGDGNSSLGIAPVLAAPPASTEYGLAVRVVSGPSSAADLAFFQSNFSTIMTVAAFPAGSSQVEIRVLPAGLLSTSAPAANSSGLNVWLVNPPSTIVSVAALPANSSKVEITTFPAGMLSTAAPAANSSGLNVWMVNNSTIRTIAAVLDSSGASAQVGDAANKAIRVNVVAGAAGGSTNQTISGVLDSSGATAQVGDVPNNALRVNVVAGAAGGSTMMTISGTATSTSAPAANSSGLVVWQVGYSTIVSVAAFPANSSKVEITTFPAGMLSTAAPAANSSGLNVWLVNQSTIVTIAAFPANSSKVEITTFPSGLMSTGAPSSGSSGLNVRQVLDVILTTASTNGLAGSTALSIQSSGAGIRSYVTAYSILSTNGGPVKLAFYSGATMTWPVILAAVSSAVSGANVAVFPYLFRTAASDALTLNIKGTTLAGFQVAVSYYRAP